MRKKDTYTSPPLTRVKPKRHFFRSLLKRHHSETGLVEDKTSSVTIVRIIIGLLLLHLIIIGGVLLRGHLVRDAGETTTPPTVNGPPTVATRTDAGKKPGTTSHPVLPATQPVAPVAQTSAPNHITQTGGMAEDDTAEEVPEDDVTVAPAATSTPVYHLVATGDTWQNVAEQYAVSASALRSANPTMTEDDLSVGATLVIPAGRAAGRDVTPPANGEATRRTPAGTSAPAVAGNKVHVVQRGETLSRISRKEKVPMKEIMRLNGLKDPNRISPGMQLKLGR